MAEPGVRPHVELGEAKMVQIKQSRRSLALVAAALSGVGLLTGWPIGAWRSLTQTIVISLWSVGTGAWRLSLTGQSIIFVS